MKKLSILLGLGAMMSVIAFPAAAQDSFGGKKKASPPAQQQQPMQQPQAQPQQQTQPPAQQQGYGQQQGNQQGGGKFAQVEQMESKDFGVAPIGQLYSGAMHGPTPTTIPGGLVITTEALWTTLQQNQNSIAIFDVLGSNVILPGALAAAPASAPGNFNDQTQQEFGQYIQQVTGGNKQTPVLFYCQSPQCWMSYNAALRAINMGYTQVLWYRGGLEAWQMAGLPTQSPY